MQTPQTPQAHHAPQTPRATLWHGLVWLLTATLAAGWSLLCWALLQLITVPDWGVVGDAGWTDWLARWRVPAWLADWLPLGAIGDLLGWLTALGPWLESLLAQAPNLMGWLSPVLWAAWAVGLLVLLMLGVAGSVLVVALKRPPAPVGAGRSG